MLKNLKAVRPDILLIIALCVILAALITFAILKVLAPTKPIKKVEAPVATESSIAAKGDMEPIRQIASTASKAVESERIIPPVDAPARMPPMVIVQDEDKPAQRRGRLTVEREKKGREYCASHNMKMELTKNGTSWRCRK